MSQSNIEQSGTVWGDKGIIDQLEHLLGWRPSMSWFRRWSAKDHPHRLPVKQLVGSKMRCAEIVDLMKWKEKNIK